MIFSCELCTVLNHLSLWIAILLWNAATRSLDAVALMVPGHAGPAPRITCLAPTAVTTGLERSK
jgi:hypothetical protein